MSEATYSDLTSVVNLFRALTHEELETALSEFVFKQSRETDGDTLSGAISDVVDTYYLIPYKDGETDVELLTVDPMAFPTLPDRTGDLPYIPDYPTRGVSRNELTMQVEPRLRVAAANAVQTGDANEIERLLDMTYNLEAWADTGVGSIREHLDAALDTERQT